MKISKIANRIIYPFSTSPIVSPYYSHLSTVYSPDLKLHLHQYTHTKTNARIYHFQNADPDNTYATIVKTYVQNDKGCPHILQHLACCGSKKYPIRDPFFNMIKRSVNSYMNAWTGDDFTSYPFASANPKDRDNLYKVYLDMSLKPLLNELDFRQEGWRYQLNNEGVRQLKGIVLNEMKGAYQDADRQMIKQINQELFRGTPYIYDSGGRPNQIVNLQYSELVKMYEYYYHPSNMSFYFYGNTQITDSLQYMAQEYLNNYQDQSHIYNKINVIPEPVQNKHKNVISHTAQNNSISINYYLGSIESLTPLQSLCLRIISYLMLQKSNALVYKKFIETGIAQNLGFSGFNQAKMTTFTVTLKGIFPEYECQQFQTDFRSIFEQVIQKGVDIERVKQFVHQFEVNLLTPRENNGIRILEQCMNSMNHRLDLAAYLNPRPYVEQAVVKLGDSNFVKTLFSKFFLENSKVVVVRQLMAEKQLKQQPIVSKVTIQDSKIRQQQDSLLARQNQKQDPSILPMLSITDIIKPTRLSPTLFLNKKTNGKQFNHYHVKINEDINYYRLVFNFPTIDQQFLERVSLWAHTINRTISTANFSYNELTSWLANHTAGFNVLSSIGGNNDVNLIFEFSCLKKNIVTAFSLLQQIILTPKFEKQHTLNAYRAFVNQVTEGLVQNPMNECQNEAGSQLTRVGSILNSYQRIKDSFKLVKEQRIQDLYQVSLCLNNCSNIRLIQHSNQQGLSTPALVDKLLAFAPKQMEQFTMPSQILSKAVTYSYMVNFCTQQYVAPKYLSKEHAHINLLLQLLQQDYLHPLIREKGGAYGSGAKIRNNGTISLSSYLDPNSTATFEVFENSVKDLLSKDTIEADKILQAKIKQFGDVDRIKVPQNEGVNQILRGYSEEDLQNFRETLKHSKFQQIVESGRAFMLNQPKARCIFGKTSPTGFIQQKLKNYLL